MNIEDFLGYADNVLKRHSNRKKIFSQTVYHYTSAAALESIIKGRTLWFTNHRHLNDSMEVQLGIDICKEIILKNKKIQYKDLLIAYIDKTIEIITSEQMNYYFLSCSLNKNSLPMLRHYADDGKGFIIGFNPDFPMDNEDKLNVREKIVCAKVQYDRRRVHKDISRLVNYYQIFEKKADNNDNCLKLCRGFVTYLLLICSISKDNSFSYEEELRLILTDGPLFDYQLKTVNTVNTKMTEGIKNTMLNNKIIYSSSYINKKRVSTSPFLDNFIRELIIGPVIPPKNN